MRRTGGGDQRVKEREWKMRRTDRGGLNRLKNRSGKCEGPTGGARRVKEPEWEIRRTGVAGGGPTVVWKEKFF
jgi:hypothetical protein